MCVGGGVDRTGVLPPSDCVENCVSLANTILGLPSYRDGGKGVDYYCHVFLARSINLLLVKKNLQQANILICKQPYYKKALEED
jgi:hypothetical protein